MLFYIFCKYTKIELKSMPFKKGTPKAPTSGRKKGVQNKVTAVTREMLTQLSAETYETFKQRLLSIDDPVDFCNIWLKAQEYVLPKLAHQDVEVKAVENSGLAYLRTLAESESSSK